MGQPWQLGTAGAPGLSTVWCWRWPRRLELWRHRAPHCAAMLEPLQGGRTQRPRGVRCRRKMAGQAGCGGALVRR